MSQNLGITVKPAEYEIWYEIAPGDVRSLCTEDTQENAERSLQVIRDRIASGKIPLDLLSECRPHKELSVGDLEQFFTKKREKV
ncbi:hypothetical protein [Merismopedia glauca]|uniref:Uncharacterized protein n=1 Tax=Merismopedia glauca CCAP 1448/3 TaxID=1296344 RepID=A0A2T1BX33_9CYAN|nr:hypothetical protein [Merismopedia glauca]PSB00484.1 hypothetical protein C7B64_23265 [Merismopedia glauca CCAP 1448/3]